MRDNISGLDVSTKKRLLAMRTKTGRALDTVIGVVRRIEPSGKFAHVKWLGRHATSREPMSRLTTIKRKGRARG